jgi:hypothetical protein
MLEPIELCEIVALLLLSIPLGRWLEKKGIL